MRDSLRKSEVFPSGAEGRSEIHGAATQTKASPPPATRAATIAEAFRITSAERADDVAIRTKGDEIAITWGELRERADALAGGLARLGLGHGDTIALMLSNRPEFHVCDLGAMMLGATPFSIYNTYTPDQIRYIVADAEAKLLICEQQYLPRVLEAREQLPLLEHVIVVDGDAPEGVLALSQVEGSNPEFDVEASVKRIQPMDLLTLIYTSGTSLPCCSRRTLRTAASIAACVASRCSGGWPATIVSSPAFSFSQMRGTAKNQLGLTSGR